jgi:hypothetical protein
LASSVFPHGYLRGVADGEYDDGTEEKCTCGATCGADTGANCTNCTVCTNGGTDCGATDCGQVTCGQCTQITPADREDRSGRAATFALLQEQLRQTLAQAI